MKLIFILVEFMFCSFVIAGFSMGMPLLGILALFVALFITPLSDYILPKLGKKGPVRNIKFIVGALGFVLLCYMVPDSKINEVRQRQVTDMQEQLESQNETELESETGYESGETSQDETVDESGV